MHRTDDVVELAWGEFAKRVPIAQWHEAVVTFADQVRAFYDTNPPLRRSRGGDRDAMENDEWDAFWVEWVSRRTRVKPSSPASRPAFTDGGSSRF